MYVNEKHHMLSPGGGKQGVTIKITFDIFMVFFLDRNLASQAPPYRRDLRHASKKIKINFLDAKSRFIGTAGRHHFI
jgi:hypothetical protein